MHTIRVIDSHTAGEPTRLVLDGGPPLGEGPLVERLKRFRGQFDEYRSAIVNEPRGSDPLVGALLVEPHNPGCSHGVIFFNNVGYLGMCGHGTIGLIASLSYLGALAPGDLKIDTPVGVIEATLSPTGDIRLANVVSYRLKHRLAVDVPGIGLVSGDVAWGGNWFFLISDHDQRIDLGHVEALTNFSRRVRAALNSQGHPLVDHIELFCASDTAGVDSRNFVLCPGDSYDRSPCGTGTSAKLACLAADGKLAEGDAWVQESLIGSTFSCRYRWHDRGKGEIVPIIGGTAHVTAESTLRLDPKDPFRWGIR